MGRGGGVGLRLERGKMESWESWCKDRVREQACKGVEDDAGMI